MNTEQTTELLRGYTHLVDEIGTRLLAMYTLGSSRQNCSLARVMDASALRYAQKMLVCMEHFRALVADIEEELREDGAEDLEKSMRSIEERALIHLHPKTKGFAGKGRRPKVV